MPVTTFIGIDLAWRSHNPTGAAVLKGDRKGARLEVVTSLSPEHSIPDFISSHVTDNTVVAIRAKPFKFDIRNPKSAILLAPPLPLRYGSALPWPPYKPTWREGLSLAPHDSPRRFLFSDGSDEITIRNAGYNAFS